METLMDPEIPVLSVIDLGIIRDVKIEEDEAIITITPTYSGCPAMDVISMNIRMELMTRGFKKVTINQVLSPPWTTDWMNDTAKKKLQDYGIAPPNAKQQVCRDELFAPNEAVACPRCGSYHTTRVSEFGSTACKALYKCEDCREPFDYFKCHK
jgi:ring-1,2-phenylacetyl-CoA epoxidase subunit PaaD